MSYDNVSSSRMLFKTFMVYYVYLFQRVNVTILGYFLNDSCKFVKFVNLPSIKYSIMILKYTNKFHQCQVQLFQLFCLINNFYEKRQNIFKQINTYATIDNNWNIIFMLFFFPVENGNSTGQMESTVLFVTQTTFY